MESQLTKLCFCCNPWKSEIWNLLLLFQIIMNQNHNKNNMRFINRNTFKTKRRRLKTKHTIFCLVFHELYQILNEELLLISMYGSLNCNWLEAEFWISISYLNFSLVEVSSMSENLSTSCWHATVWSLRLIIPNI